MLARELARYENDLRRLERSAMRRLKSDVPLAALIGKRQMSGGKGLRAAVALASARICGLSQADGDRIAVAIEIIHAATLLHDDVVDDAPIRRRRDTANRLYGNAAAVLAGDFLYSRASQILAETGSMPLLAQIAAATNSLAEGEMLQLSRRGRMTGEKAYFDVISKKTASLFESAAAAPALARGGKDGGMPAEALSGFGRNLGMAFQLIDDCLDYTGDDAETGKKIGTDFAEGKMTLPAILALARTKGGERRALTAGWRRGDAEAFSSTLRLVRETGALDETQRRAVRYAELAEDSLASLPAASRRPLATLARASVNRRQ